MTALDLRHAAASHVGLVRDTNEDAWLTAPPVFAVADGMGGHDAGDVASGIVVEELAELAAGAGSAFGGADRSAAGVAAALRESRRRIADYAAAQLEAGAASFTSGTTATVAVLTVHDGAPAWLLANLGDSRAYRLGTGSTAPSLRQVTVDHSLVQELVDAGLLTGDEARHHPDRNVVTRAVGAAGEAEPDLVVLPVEVGERLLLCSDGISDLLDETEIAAVLAREPDAAAAAQGLVDAALRAGGHDNATAVVVDVDGVANPPPEEESL